MRHLLIVLLSLFVVVILPAGAQTKAERKPSASCPRRSVTLGLSTTATSWRR